MTTTAEPTTTQPTTNPQAAEPTRAEAVEPTTTEAGVGTVVHVDPASLLVDRNIRQAQLSRPFVASIKTHGVLTPVVAVRTTDEAGAVRLRVRTGHRRTLAAVQAGRATIPVYVAGPDTADSSSGPGGSGVAGEVARIVEQYTENEHRAGLRTTERAAAVEQLALLGLSAGQIAARTKAAKADVSAALAVAGSAVARAAADRWEFLTLDQSAALAEFDQPDRPDGTGGRDEAAITALVAAARQGPVQFARAVQTARADAADRAARAQATAALRAVGVRVLDAEPAWTDTTVSLAGLYDPADPAAAPLTAEHHAACPGHVAWAVSEWQRPNHHHDDQHPGNEHEDAADDAANDEDDDQAADQDNDDGDGDGYVLVYRAVLGCTDPRTHGHADRRALRYATRNTTGGGGGLAAGGDGEAEQEAQREARRAERRTVIARNKAMDAAAPIRRDWVRALLARKTPPAGTAAFLAAALATGRADPGTAAPSLLAQLLSRPDNTPTAAAAELAAAAPTEARALVIALAIALGGYEQQVQRDAWRQSWPAHRAYLTFLADHGYPLSDVEAVAAGRTTDTTDHAETETSETTDHTDSADAPR